MELGSPQAAIRQTHTVFENGVYFFEVQESCRDYLRYSSILIHNHSLFALFLSSLFCFLRTHWFNQLFFACLLAWLRFFSPPLLLMPPSAAPTFFPSLFHFVCPQFPSLSLWNGYSFPFGAFPSPLGVLFLPLCSLEVLLQDGGHLV